MALYFIKDTTLKGIADAIRTKTGDSASIPVADFASEIESIVVGDGSSSGGGSGDGDTIIGYEVITKSGTFETGSGVESKTITHNCSGMPDLVIVYLKRNDLTICGDYTTFIYSTSKLNVGDMAICSGLAYENGSSIYCTTTTFKVPNLVENSRYGWYAMKLVDKEISGSGGGDHTVTFMSEDGTTILCEKPVMNGDTCGDPISLGLMEKPTKASTAQYDYTFSGWATSAGGAASSSALVNITADRTVYVAFESKVRYYTINFYDGETILKTMICEYGTTPEYTPEKAGYIFSGWDKELVPVTSDADYYAQWEEIITGTQGTATWSIKNGTLTLSGNGAVTGFSSDTSEKPWDLYINNITKVVIEEGITGLGTYLFYGLTSLVEVDFPESINSIQMACFRDCSSLTEVAIPDSVTTISGHLFNGCVSLNSVMLGAGIETIWDYAFKGCTALMEITIPSNVNRLYANAFNGSHFSSVTFENTTGWYTSTSSSATSGTTMDVTDPVRNAEMLTSTYTSRHWRRS